MFIFFSPLFILIIFTVLAPIIGFGAGRKKVSNLLEAYTIVGFIASLLSLYPLYTTVALNGKLIVGFAPLPGSVLVTDMLGVFLTAIFLLLGLAAAIFSIRYMEHDKGLAMYYTLLLAMVAGMVGVVSSGDFFTLFLFWEVMCISSYILVAFRKDQWEPIEAGFKYLVMSATGSAFLLLSIGLLYGMTGTTNFAAISSTLHSAGPLVGQSQRWMYLTIGLIVAGFGIKAAIVPFHAWLPDAHPAAPSPISAMLSGVVIKSGVYGLIRILFLFFGPGLAIGGLPIIDWGLVLMILGFFAVITMTVGNIMALLQGDLKRLLAFSSIGQVGYIILAVSLGTIAGLTSGLFHVMNHAIMKGLLFLCVGAFVHAAGTRDIEKLAGIAHKMKGTGVAFAVGALAISGIPPFNGFWSEFMIIFSGLSKGGIYMFFTVVMLANVIMGFAYYLRMLYVVAWKESRDELNSVKEAPVSMLFPLLLLMLLCIVIGLWPQPFVNFARGAAEAAMNLQ